MAASLLSRALGALEMLSRNPAGAPLQVIADEVGMPKSGAHRLMSELIEHGYVTQETGSGRYVLTLKLASLGFSHLADSGIVDVVQPTLDRLAISSSELIRLAVVDGERLVFIAKAQGARTGLRYDPQNGQEVDLFCTATGYAWLSTLTDERAIELIARQGLTNLDERGPKVPRSYPEILEHLERTRKLGYSLVVDVSAPGMSAIAVNVCRPGTEQVLGVLSIGGPTARLSREALEGHADELRQAADEISKLSALSDYLTMLAI